MATTDRPTDDREQTVTDQPDPFELFGLSSAGGSSAEQPTESASAPPPVGGAAPEPLAPPRAPRNEDAGEYVAVKGGGGGRRGGGRGRRIALMAGIPLLVLVLLVGATGLWVKGKIDPGNPGEEVAFTIPKGATTSQVTDLLAQKGIISSGTVFSWYLRWNDVGGFQAGDYRGLRTNMAMGDVVDILEAGPPPPETIKFTVREGLWESETRALILEKFPQMTPESLDVALRDTHPSLQPAGSSNLEGFLFPATYEIAQTDVADAQKLIDQMIAAFDRVSATTGLPDASAQLAGVAGRRVITPYEALIVASLVESEAKIDEDRPKIARVIYNRLARGEILGIDASVLYAIGERKAEITSSDLRTDSPYNTRLKNGLPPTPINSPGQKSIEAALNPAPGDWLYYVLTDTDGRHYFTASAADFNRAVADAKARGVF